MGTCVLVGVLLPGGSPRAPRNVAAQESNGLPWAGGMGTAETEREGSSAGDEAHGTRSEGGTESDLRGTRLFGGKNMCQPPGFSSKVTVRCFRGQGRVHGRPAHDLGLGRSPKGQIQGGECFWAPWGFQGLPLGALPGLRETGKPGAWAPAPDCAAGGGASHRRSPQGNPWGLHVTHTSLIIIISLIQM